MKWTSNWISLNKSHLQIKGKLTYHRYSCLENPYGQRSLAGYSPLGRKESNTTEATVCTHAPNGHHQSLVPRWSDHKLSVQLSQSVMSNPLQPHGLQHARPPCPSPTLTVYSNLCPLSRWCHPIISFSVIHFSSCLQSFPASGSFPLSQIFTSGGQSIGVSFSISPSNEYSGLISFRMDWLDLLAVQGTHKTLLQHHSLKASILQCSDFFIVQISHPYMTTGKAIGLTGKTFVGKIMALLFNMLSRFAMAFLPRSVFSYHGWNHHPRWFWSLRK